MDNKKMVKIVLALLIIGAIGLIVYNSSFKSTEVTGLVESDSPYEHIGTSFTFTAYFDVISEQHDDQYIDVSIIDGNNNIVEEFRILGDGEDSKTVSDLSPGIYTVNYNFTGGYPYRSSSDIHQINCTPSSDLKSLEESYSLYQKASSSMSSGARGYYAYNEAKSGDRLTPYEF